MIAKFNTPRGNRSRFEKRATSPEMEDRSETASPVGPVGGKPAIIDAEAGATVPADIGTERGIFPVIAAAAGWPGRAEGSGPLAITAWPA